MSTEKHYTAEDISKAAKRRGLALVPGEVTDIVLGIRAVHGNDARIDRATVEWALDGVEADRSEEGQRFLVRMERAARTKQEREG